MRTATVLLIALLIVAAVWYPHDLGSVTVAGLLVTAWLVAHRPPSRAKPGWGKQRSRWFPGVGLGWSLLSRRPFAYLSVWRWRR